MSAPAFPLSTETEAFFAVRRARLVRFNGAWYTREPGGAYREIGEELLRAEIRSACEWALTPANVNAALDEIRSATVVDGHNAAPPLWLDDMQGMPDAAGLIVCRNGILEPITETLWQHDERLFTLNALTFDYSPRPNTPARWLRFLDEVFASDAEAIAELQKTFGYLLTQRTDLQKIFAIIGPRRSGKGTIGRVLEALIGKPNVASPSFSDLSGDFGMQGLIGKQVAVVSDARVTARTDRMAVTEKLLRISGEDSVDVPRKYLQAWHGRLGARFLILSNELPNLPDASGALNARYVLFQTPVTFAGREDRTLDDQLRAELPGVLRWALDGLRRLAIEGDIHTPASARELLDEVGALGSPVRAFVNECCSFGPAASVSKDALWTAYGLWHRMNGLPGAPLSKEMFGRNLRTVFPAEIKEFRPRLTEGGPRVRFWSGLTLDQTPISLDHNPDHAPSINYVVPNVPLGPGAVQGRSG